MDITTAGAGPVRPATAGDVADRNESLVRTFALIKCLSHRWARFVGLDPDDLAQDASLRFLRCWGSNDRSKGTDTMYAAYCVRASAHTSCKMASGAQHGRPVSGT